MASIGDRHTGAAVEALENIDQTADTDKSRSDPYWDLANLDDINENWDQQFPFQLLILKKTGKTYSTVDLNSKFTLPMPPESLTISTPYAINVSVTMGGILEEHNGAPLRTISLTGSTGVLPLRKQVDKPSRLATTLSSIFAGTTGGVNQVTTALSQAGNMLGLPGNLPANVHADGELKGSFGGNSLLNGTGFTQFQLLQRFLESYVNRKKAGASDLRLGLAIWKEGIIYLCTPRSFDMSRSAQSPLEYRYALNLTAWRRITLKELAPGGSYAGSPGVRSPNGFAVAMNTLEGARRILEGARKTLEGVRADVQKLLYEPLRQATLFAKDVVGTSLALADLPANIVRDMREPLLEFAALGNFAKSRAGEVGQNYDRATREVAEAFEQLLPPTQKNEMQGARPVVVLPPTAYQAEKILNNSQDYYLAFSELNVGSLNLRPETRRKINTEIEDVRESRREDFQDMRDSVLQVAGDFADYLGEGDTTFDTTYGRPTGTQARNATDDDWEVLYALNQAAQALDAFAATRDTNRDEGPTSIDYVAGLASRSGIAFTVPTSKYAVPFPYGHTLEQIANMYLGNPDRWHEIAALNGLRAPYVDELGFTLPLLANGLGNRILVADGSNLFSGQKVWLSSSTVRRESRRVLSVTKLSVTQYAVILDGDEDLDRFTTPANAFLQAFLPDTVNSQQQIYIPSTRTPDEDAYLVKTIPGVDYFNPLVKSGGIDLLLNPDGDLVITPDGDSRLAIGLTNLIQKVKLVIGTPRGSLLHHPSYGTGLKPGASTAEISANDVAAGVRAFMNDDPGYSGVQSLSVLKGAGFARINLSIGISGTGTFVPISVDLRA